MVRPILQSTVRLITGSGVRRSSEFVPYLLFGLVLGALVDRVDRKRALTALIAVLFAFSPVAQGGRYLAMASGDKPAGEASCAQA